MGIAVKELLTLEYFKDYYVIAGKSGLHKEIQGTTLLEAPDALRWAKAKDDYLKCIPELVDKANLTMLSYKKSIANQRETIEALQAELSQPSNKNDYEKQTLCETGGVPDKHGRPDIAELLGERYRP